MTWIVPLTAANTAGLAEQVRQLISELRHVPPPQSLQAQRPGSSGALRGQVRAALFAENAGELAAGLETVAAWLAAGTRTIRASSDALLARPGEEIRVGLLFPGQGAPVHTGPGGLAELFPDAAEVYTSAGLESEGGAIAPQAVQLAVVASSLAALRAVRAAGIEARFALGHSLGELTGLCWAGAFNETALFELARTRGRAMARSSPSGTMAAISSDADAFAELVRGSDVVLACENSPRQRIVSGEVAAVERIVRRAKESGARAVQLRVTGAFHSPLMAAAAPAFRRALDATPVSTPRRPLLSTVTGGWLDSRQDVRKLLVDQLTAPVRFIQAARLASAEADLMVETGPGRTLTALAAETTGLPTLAVQAGERSSRGGLRLAALGWACGAANLDERRVASVPAVAR